MGGKAFSPALRTPRIPTSIYHDLRSQHISLLSTFYKYVASPREVPEKLSHGDIDILVCVPLDLLCPPTSTILSVALSAVHTLCNTAITSFAIPYPGKLGNFVQVDVLLVPSEELFKWQLFHTSYGDFWNILGTAIRPFGLTANERGLFLRISEIEDVDKNRSLVFLCSEPDAVLAFCTGMDIEDYKRGWVTLGDMFRWLSRGRFMRKDNFVRSRFNANDRKRLGQREVYRRFVEECVPSWADHISEGRNELVTRREVLEEALQLFGKWEEYERKIEERRTEVLSAPIKKELRKLRIVEEVEYADAWINSLREAPAAKNSV